MTAERCLATQEDATPMTTHVDTGFSHSRGLVCTQCPVDEWPAWSNRAISDLFEQVKALPADGATKSRDYGRGYSRAVRDVLELFRGLNAHGDAR